MTIAGRVTNPVPHHPLPSINAVDLLRVSMESLYNGPIGPGATPFFFGGVLPFGGGGCSCADASNLGSVSMTGTTTSSSRSFNGAGVDDFFGIELVAESELAVAASFEGSAAVVDSSAAV